jgi:hypothetical protein
MVAGFRATRLEHSMGQTASDDEWDREFSPRAENQFSQLDVSDVVNMVSLFI